MMFGIGALALQRRHGLRPDALDRVAVEARLGQRQPQQFEGFVLVLLAASAACRGLVSRLAEAQLDRPVLQALMEGGGVEVAGALVEQSTTVISASPPLSVGILAAPPWKANRSRPRHGAVAHQPELDAAGADDALDLGGARRR